MTRRICFAVVMLAALGMSSAMAGKTKMEARVYFDRADELLNDWALFSVASTSPRPASMPKADITL